MTDVKKYVPLIFTTIILVVFVSGIQSTGVSDLIPFMPEGKAIACSYSSYNVYTNSTDASYFFGKCYVETHLGWYDDKEACGFLGISCYERSEPISKPISGTACFKLKTGKNCN